MGKLIDLTGQRFGRLVVIKRSKAGNDGSVYWYCRCDCGKEVIVKGSALRSGHTKSCGCFNSDFHRSCLEQTLFKNKPCDGRSRTRLYPIWRSMRDRCNNPNCKAYPRYGGRGISVCAEWANSFDAFRAWALSRGYAENLSIDRIDNNKGYCPENCRWVSVDIQCRNRRSNVYISYGGEAQTLSDWAREYGLDSHVIRYRLKHGWPIERALTEPAKKKK